MLSRWRRRVLSPKSKSTWTIRRQLFCPLQFFGRRFILPHPTHVIFQASWLAFLSFPQSRCLFFVWVCVGHCCPLRFDWIRICADNWVFFYCTSHRNRWNNYLCWLNSISLKFSYLNPAFVDRKKTHMSSGNCWRKYESTVKRHGSASFNSDNSQSAGNTAPTLPVFQLKPDWTRLNNFITNSI